MIASHSLDSGTPLTQPPKADPRIAQYLPLCRSRARQYLRRMRGQRDFEDLVNVALVAVWKATQSHDEDGAASFGTYVRTCVKNALENERKEVWAISRRTAMAQISMSPASEDDLPLDLPSQDPSPLALLSSARDHRLVREAMAQIKPGHRAVLEDLFFGESDQVEVAKSSSVSRQAVQQLSVEALRSLARTLSERDPEAVSIMKPARKRRRDA